MTTNNSNIPIFKEVSNYKHQIKISTPKKIIVIHGTGGGNVSGCINTFTPTGVSVPFVIDRDGLIYKLYDEKFDHWHAGGNFRDISAKSIGIELVNWNHLTLKNGKYLTWTNTVIEPSNVLIVNRV